MSTSISIQKLSQEEWEAKVKSFGEKAIENPDTKDADGCTFLYWAVAADNLKYVVALLYRGADPNIHNNVGDCPVALAIRNSNWDMVDLLEKFGGMC